MRIANAEGKDWKSEIHTFLLTYRSTPNKTTGVSPAKLIFNREIRTKIPLFKEEAVKFQEVKDRDAEKKQKGKDHADQRRHAVESEVVIGDKVLMERPKLNKLTPRYSEKPLTVVEKTGSVVTVESQEGAKYKRNSSHLKKFNEPVSSEPVETPCEVLNKPVTTTDTTGVSVTNLRTLTIQ